MPLVWIYRQPEQQWRPLPLDAESIALPGEAEQPVAVGNAAAATIVPAPHGGAARVLIAPPGQCVRVNGEALLLGFRVLHHRDAIRVGKGESVFFSSESLPRVVPFCAARVMPCARCKTQIELGTPALKCPHCGSWHHQSDELACWTYNQKCAACEQPTAMDGNYHWSPEGL